MYPQFRTASSQAGFSLVELMVAMTLSLVLLAGALSILYTSKLTSTQNERMARIQESGRTAMELILQDTRGAGFTGCVRPQKSGQFGNSIVNSASLLWNLGEPINGFHSSGATWLPVLDAAIPASPTPTPKSDVLVLRAVRPGAPIFRTNSAMTAATDDLSVDLLTGTQMSSGTTALISDCRGSAAFVVSSLTASGATGTITHVDGGADPANVSTSLPRTFDLGAQITPVETVIYYIASCTAVSGACTSVTPPALWAIEGSGPPQELIEGVEAMQVRYGVDTDNDLIADSYQTADQVTAVATWNNVVSMNISMLIRSVNENGTDVDAKAYHLPANVTSNYVTYGPYNDRRQRAIYTTTANLRNQTP